MGHVWLKQRLRTNVDTKAVFFSEVISIILRVVIVRGLGHPRRKTAYKLDKMYHTVL